MPLKKGLLGLAITGLCFLVQTCASSGFTEPGAGAVSADGRSGLDTGLVQGHESRGLGSGLSEKPADSAPQEFLEEYLSNLIFSVRFPEPQSLSFGLLTQARKLISDTFGPRLKEERAGAGAGVPEIRVEITPEISQERVSGNFYCRTTLGVRLFARLFGAESEIELGQFSQSGPQILSKVDAEDALANSLLPEVLKVSGRIGSEGRAALATAISPGIGYEVRFLFNPGLRGATEFRQKVYALAQTRSVDFLEQEPEFLSFGITFWGNREALVRNLSEVLETLPAFGNPRLKSFEEKTVTFDSGL